MSYAYENGGVYTKGDKVNYTWAITQLYRAVGVEQVEYYVLTEGREPYEGEPSDKPTYDINSSPLAQFITMATKGVDLSAVISNVYATRTNPDTYLEMATKDCLGVVPAADRESQTLTIGEFCLLAYKLMDLYGEPVLTEKKHTSCWKPTGRTFHMVFQRFSWKPSSICSLAELSRVI